MLQRDYIMRLVRQFIEALEKLVEDHLCRCVRVDHGRQVLLLPNTL